MSVPIALYVPQAVRVALRSNHKCHKHGCLIVNDEDGQVISTGYNHHPSHVHEEGEDAWMLHAEMHALAKVKAKTMQAKYPNCTMLVVRAGPPSQVTQLRTSMPCKVCQRMILNHPCIRRVYYS